ncbi:MAG: hypothetical protein FIB04_11055 [Gammaproteobacteria bacterium]|nr:hypothetical protein [Gammaproteobacteria bacterium]
MTASRRTLLAALAICAAQLGFDTAVGSTDAADVPRQEPVRAQVAESPRTSLQVAATPAADDPDDPHTTGALVGGLLLLGLTAAGLTITYRALVAERKERRHRYRRRMHREPDHAARA